MNQQTLSSEFTLTGMGLHTGNKTTIVFKPAPENTGVIFIRDDLSSKPSITLDHKNVFGVIRGTTIGDKLVHIHTVEHILAALSALGIDNVFIHMDNNEPPVLDGSSKLYVDEIIKAGIAEQKSPKNYFRVLKRVEYINADTKITAEPSEKLEIDCTIIYDHPMIKSQRFISEITPETFAQKIAPARTFCFDHEIESLQKRGLGKGGDLTNTIVIGHDKYHIEDGLRFEDEFVRHKVLDLIGDMYLLGMPLKAKITAVKSGHRHNINFARKLIEENFFTEEKMPVKTNVDISIGEMLDLKKIQAIIPHRYPFLMIDKVIITEEQKKAVGYKAVSGNEGFFQGHFPGNPIMPGVLIVEAMAQTAGVLFLSRPDLRNKIAYFMSIENAKFRRPVLPGDYLELRITVTKARERFGKIKGEAYVGSELVTEAEFSFALVDKTE